MAWPAYTIQDLSIYSGRPEQSYTPFSTTALAQSLLLFKIYTCLKDWPTDPDKADLAKMAVLSMADTLVLGQPYTLVQANPFSSESIGSYSYSKAQKQLAAGLPTGVSWFDLAIQHLGECETGPNGGVITGSINVFENDAKFVEENGRRRVLGPADLIELDVPYFVSSQNPQP